MAYRTNSYSPYQDTRSKFQQWRDIYGDDLFKLSIGVGVIVLVLLMQAVFAAIIQWVVTGIAERPMGNFYHYWVGLIIFNFLRMRTTKKDS